jgi:hypothetical protein
MLRAVVMVLTSPARISPSIGSLVSGSLLQSTKVTAMRTVMILMMISTLLLLASNVDVRKSELLLHESLDDMMVSVLLYVFLQCSAADDVYPRRSGRCRWCCGYGFDISAKRGFGNLKEKVLYT